MPAFIFRPTVELHPSVYVVDHFLLTTRTTDMHPFKKGIIVTALLYAFSVASMIFVTDMITGPDRAFEKLETPAPLSEYAVKPEDPKSIAEKVWQLFNDDSNRYVFIKDFEALGEPVSYSNGESESSYLPVRATSIDGKGEVHEDVFVLHCDSNELDIEATVADGSLKGTLFQPNLKERELREHEIAIQDQYPDLDPRNAARIWLYTPMPSYFYYIAWGFWGYLFFGLVYTVWAFHRAWKKEQEWFKRTEEFQQSDIVKYPKAVRLVHGDPSLSPSSLAPRSIDPTYDVPAKPDKKHPKSRAFAWRLLAVAISAGVVCIVQAGLFYFDAQWNTGIVSAVGFMFVLTMTQVFLQLGITSINKSRQETPVKEKKAHYRRRAFHQYHDKVLKELGFRDIGDYRLVGANDPLLLRTIYLSPQGNTLAEVGVEFGKQFFTIETLTNDGKFLETHSLATKLKEKLDPNVRHLRRAADHEDILKALEEHDDFVAERTYGGSVLEAQFTEERFGRFLAWPSEKV